MRTIAIVLACAMSAAAVANFSYSGSLQHPSGVYVGGSSAGNWAGLGVSWTVSQNNPGDLVLYSYVFTATTNTSLSDFSHLVIEVSDSFTAADFSNLTINGVSWTETEVGDFNEANGNPAIPTGFYGLKFDETADLGNVLSISFLSTRLPVWGDFYAKSGNVYAYNLGFTNPDTDPDPLLFPPSNGSVSNHLLVPDTVTIIPAPAAVVLGFIGLVLIRGVADRRWLN